MPEITGKMKLKDVIAQIQQSLDVDQLSESAQEALARTRIRRGQQKIFNAFVDEAVRFIMQMPGKSTWNPDVRDWIRALLRTDAETGLSPEQVHAIVYCYACDICYYEKQTSFRKAIRTLKKLTSCLLEMRRSWEHKMDLRDKKYAWVTNGLK